MEFCGGNEVFLVITISWRLHEGFYKDHPVSAVIVLSPHTVQSLASSSTL
jgi:hypothetical protein